jgi:hypothetical protein
MNLRFVHGGVWSNDPSWGIQTRIENPGLVSPFLFALRKRSGWQTENRERNYRGCQNQIPRIHVAVISTVPRAANPEVKPDQSQKRSKAPGTRLITKKGRLIHSSAPSEFFLLEISI